MNSGKAQKELCELLDEVDTEAMLCAMVGLGMRLSSNETEYGHSAALIEIIAFNAIPRFGKNTEKPISMWDFHRCYELAEKSLKEVMNKSRGVTDDLQNIYPISRQLKVYSDVVRGSENSDQLKKKILEIQGHFDKWFKANTGISPSKAIELIFSLVDHLEFSYNDNQGKCKKYAKLQRENYTRLKKKSKKQLDESEKDILEKFKDADTLEAFEFFNKCNEIMPLVLPIDIEELETEDPITKQEVEVLKKLIGISKETINENIEIQRFPLYILNSGKVIFSNLNNLLDILFDAFESAAKSNIDFYNKRYQKYRAQWLEEKACNYLERIFPKNCIYKTLDYPNPDKSGTAELDIAILWSPFILLIEAKAKQFRFESLRGDVGRLRTDLKDNIEEAYEQSVRVTKYIDAGEKSIFTERGTGRKLEINKNSILKIYPISLTLNNLAGVTTQLSATKELGLFKNGCYPFSICISELDLITKSNISPDIFIHYIEKRLEALNTGEWLGYEMDLFTAYLGCRLNRKNMKNSDKCNKPYFVHSIHSEYFGQLYLYEKGLLEEKPNISLSIPEPVLELLQNLRAWNNDAGRWVAFYLLELDNKLLELLASALLSIKTAKLDNGVFRRYSFLNEKVVINLIGTNSSSLSELNDHLVARSMTEKYRRKLDKSIGIGFLCTGTPESSIFETACYLESESKWEKNEYFENLIANEPTFIPITKLPTRNEPCFCGSGLKYKKCCLKKIEESKKN